MKSAMVKQVVLGLLSYQQVDAIRGWLAWLAYYLGVAHIVGFFSHKGAKILMYHSVNHERVFWDNITQPEVFASHLRYLAARKKVVPMRLLVDRVLSGEPIPNDWVAITFDDGYQDNFVNAYPALQDQKLLASFYCTTDILRGEMHFFYDEIQSIIEHTSAKKLRLQINGRSYEFSLRSASEKKDAIIRIVLAIRNQPDDRRQSYVRQIAELCLTESGDVQNLKSLYMDESAVKRLGDGMEIGSHSITHSDLAVLASAEACREVVQSKELLEGILGKPIYGFAYPFGKRANYSSEVKSFVEKAGYRYALTTNYGAVTSGSDVFELPRIGVGNFSLVRLKVRLLGLNL